MVEDALKSKVKIGKHQPWKAALKTLQKEKLKAFNYFNPKEFAVHDHMMKVSQ